MQNIGHKNNFYSIYEPVPVATILFAKPILNASLASIDRPVNIMSNALDKPTAACNLTVPPSIRGTPTI